MTDADVLYEDNHLIAVYKRPGEIVQGDKTGNTPMSEEIKRYLKEKYHKPGNVFCGVIHRIDRPVSGVVLFAKTSKALARMNELVKERKITKTYLAIVQQRPKEDSTRLVHYLKRVEKHNHTYASLQEKEGWQKAELTYRIVGHSDRYFLLEVDLHTGRHHQIRTQLSAIGCPIKGDLKYGSARSNPDASISLHARSIAFTHPVSHKEICIEAPLPQDNLWQCFHTL